MRIIFGLAVTASLCLLAGCNRGGGANNTANAPAPAADAAANAPVESAAPPAQTPAPAAGGARNPAEIEACLRDVRNELPAGTDLDAFCNCAVDGMAQNGGRERPAMEQCAAQMGIQPQR